MTTLTDAEQAIANRAKEYAKSTDDPRIAEHVRLENILNLIAFARGYGYAEGYVNGMGDAVGKPRDPDPRCSSCGITPQEAKRLGCECAYGEWVK